jgi:hypothetical protein
LSNSFDDIFKLEFVLDDDNDEMGESLLLEVVAATVAGITQAATDLLSTTKDHTEKTTSEF